MNLKIVTGYLFALALVFPTAVSAEEFVIKAGVNLSSLSVSVQAVKVLCQIRQGLNTIAVGSEEMPVPASRSINTTIDLRFNSNPDVEINAKEAMNYSCVVLLKRKNTLGSFNVFNTFSAPWASGSASCSGASLDDNYWKCGKPGTQFVKELTGTVPSSGQ